MLLYKALVVGGRGSPSPALRWSREHAAKRDLGAIKEIFDRIDGKAVAGSARPSRRRDRWRCNGKNSARVIEYGRAVSFHTRRQSQRRRRRADDPI
jgi:hypothetical protein